MNLEIAVSCMQRAVARARQSRHEDERSHPYVGAVLSDLDGNVLLQMARGEAAPGIHAEAGLIELAKKKRIDLTKTVLFSTLEPCTWRTRKHVPCAIQVEDAAIPVIYVGMIDPDLRVCGRGEIYLSACRIVERFHPDLRQELCAINRVFLESKLPALVWAVRTYDIPRGPAERPRLSVLHRSLDVIERSDGEIWITGGDLSWLRELQPALLKAHLDGRQVRLLINREISTEVENAGLAVGAKLSHAQRPWALRATIVAPRTDHTEVLIFEAANVRELGCPEDQTLIDTLCQTFEERFGDERAGTVRIRSLGPEELMAALRRHVPQYAEVPLDFHEIPIEILRPLPSSLERFKLARWDLLSRTIESYDLPESFALDGSPWPCTPPVVEVYPDGMHVIIDGAHRVYAHRSRGKWSIDAIVAQMPGYASVPAVPRGSWDEVEIISEKVPRDQRYQWNKDGQFRGIREAFRRLLEGA